MASAENKQIEDDVELKMDLGDLDMGKLLGEGSISEVYVGKPKQRVHKTHPIHKYVQSMLIEIKKDCMLQ